MKKKTVKLKRKLKEKSHDLKKTILKEWHEIEKSEVAQALKELLEAYKNAAKEEVQRDKEAIAEAIIEKSESTYTNGLKYKKAIASGDEDVNRKILSISSPEKEILIKGKKYILIGSEMYKNEADTLAEKINLSGGDAIVRDQSFEYIDKHSLERPRKTGMVFSLYKLK